VPEQPQGDQPAKTPPDRDVPLRLAEESSDGSTMPVPGESPEEASQASAAASAGSSAMPGGTSTGGFETLLGKLVVQQGFATKEEVEACSSLLDDSDAEDDEEAEPKTLADVLISKEFVTRHQLNRLEQEFEAKKSSQRIPGYKIGRKLGSGAMATVFLAKQLSLDRLVAIKILPQKFSNNEKFIERFYKEGRAAAQLNHPNIVGAYDVGRAGEHHYFVMEYVDGPTVYDRITKKKRLKEKDAVEIVRQVALALAHAHERGFVHRDIKPKNIMITKGGVVKLADLGLARAMSDQDAAKAEAGRAYGTPYYISPEQIRGELNIGPSADIYGLGATFYHMVTGRVPFEGKNPSAVMHKHLKDSLEPPDHINPDLSVGCAQVIEMMMAKRAKERYRDANDLLEDLELVSRGEPPHFAHRTLDHEIATEALTDVVEAPAAIPVQAEPEKPSLVASPLFLWILVGLVVSVLVNLILIAIMAS
jgi:serine/threonine-protein kinase